jgi:site-specific DNA-methyltransferase (adenine-specific)
MISDVKNMDCIEGMKEFPDKFFDLAIVDPEYGIDAANMQMGKGKKKWFKKDWDKSRVNDEYFIELFRVSEKQIVFGGNYFDLPITGGWIFWDKDRQKDVSFSDGELAWTNFLTTIKTIKVKYDGFLGADIGGKIHPTQKPILLYCKILHNYAKQGDKILDTHLGSGSSRIAAYNMGFDFWGFELDTDYYEAQEKRFKEQTAQLKIFAS